MHSAHWDDFPSKEIPDKPCCKYFCHKRKKTDALQFAQYTILIFMYVIFLFIFLPPHTTPLGIFLKFSCLTDFVKWVACWQRSFNESTYSVSWQSLARSRHLIDLYSIEEKWWTELFSEEGASETWLVGTQNSCSLTGRLTLPEVTRWLLNQNAN